LEQIPALAPKFANQIGKTCHGYTVQFLPEGSRVVVHTMIDANGVPGVAAPNGNQGEAISIAEWERRRSLKNQPSEAERLAAMVRKYELRLNRECANPPASGTEAGIQAWLGTLPFAQRRALLMSQKEFNRSYPEGFRT